MTLIQQRMAIDRQRTSAVWGTITSAAALLVFSVLFVVEPDRPTIFWIGLVLLALGVVAGLCNFLAARKRRAAFDEKHGPEAGVQNTPG